METMEDDVRLSLRLPRWQWKSLRRIAEERRSGVRYRASVSGVIIAAITELLEREKPA